MGINAFIDPGYAPDIFTRQLLSSSEFKISTLRSLAGAAARRLTSKDQLASYVADEVLAGEVDPQEALALYCRQPRKWLSLRSGTATVTPQLLDPTALVYGLGNPGWYGPVRKGDDVYYMHPFIVDHCILTSGGQAQWVRVRWVLIAHLREGAASYYWDGFTHRSGENQGSNQQYPFWNVIEPAMEDLERSLEGTWDFPNLHHLILNALWDAYLHDAAFRWSHHKLRAEAQGVALNAKSSAAIEIDMGGIESLTRRLALTALDVLQSQDTEMQRQLEEELLRTLIHRWGAISYEFSLALRASGSIVFHGHTYFGLRGTRGGQDAFQHVHCYIRQGGAEVAADFLLAHLE